MAQADEELPSRSADDPKPERIVVGVDGSDLSVQALRWALRYARRTGASIKAVIAWHFPTVYAPVPVDWDPEVSARTVLEETLTSVKDEVEGLDISLEVVPGWPAAVLVDATEGADLLVLGAKGHSPLARILIGSTSIHCVSHAHCSVVVVREQMPAKA